MSSSPGAVFFHVCGDPHSLQYDRAAPAEDWNVVCVASLEEKVT